MYINAKQIPAQIGNGWKLHDDRGVWIKCCQCVSGTKAKIDNREQIRTQNALTCTYIDVYACMYVCNYVSVLYLCACAV